MPDNISSKATIAKNTTLLYGRTMLIMLVSLYTSRLILQALGVEDYGVYTAVGGVVSILTVVIGPIDNAICRFLTYELGRGDKKMLKRYFSAGFSIMLVFSLITIVILESVGLWFLNNKMVIDEDRLIAANWVLHLSIASFVVNMISSPYRASIIAHERMSLFAYMGILDAVLKLGIAFALKFSFFDKLIMYATLLLTVSFLIRFIYTLICRKEFEECRNPQFIIDKEIFGGLFSFAGWNIFGAAATVCRGQGINILFNVFGGPIVNAGYGVATQVNVAVGGLVNNFTTALNPSIIKSYAASQKSYMMSLIYQGAKFSFFLVLLFAVPLILETKYVTLLWLGQTPLFSVPFIQLMLVHTLIESLSKTIMAGTHASGRIKLYQFVVGCFQILILPVAYVLLREEFSPTSVLFLTVIIDVIALFARMLLAKGIFGLSLKTYIIKVIIPVITVTAVAVSAPLLLRLSFHEGFFRFFIVCVMSILTTALSILFIGCTATERASAITKAKTVFYHRKEQKNVFKTNL